MHILIERDTLVTALGAAGRVVERRNTIPVLSHVLIRRAPDVPGGGVSFTGCDLDMSVAADAPCEIAQPGPDFTTPAALLHDIARKLPAGAQVTIEHEPDAGRVIVKCGRSRFTLPALPDTDFPALDGGPDAPAGFDMPGKDLAALLAGCEFAISTEETRYYLNGIYLHPFDHEGEAVLRAVATDGHRLARLQIPSPEGMPDTLPGIIVPRKAVAGIVALAEKAGAMELRLAWNATRLIVAAPGARLVTKLIDGTFPDYQRVIPTANDKHLVADTERLVKAVDRVATISSERGRAVKLTLADGRLTLASRNPDVGEATDEIEVEYDAAPLEVGFNARYLADIAGAAACDTLAFELADPGSPAVIRPKGGPHNARLYVLMPMRV